MRKTTTARVNHTSRAKLRLKAETIRELATIELGGALVGGCKAGSAVTGKPPPTHLQEDGPMPNPACAMA